MNEVPEYPLAPELSVAAWLNTPHDLSLEYFQGKVVLVEVFQMLCPGCVSHALPQAMRVRQLFSEDEVAVIGLHSVFEHHEAQGSKAALKAFLHEYRISFPVAMDAPSERRGLPKTMSTYGMRGTPTLLLIDQRGNLRKHTFGAVEDMALGAEIAGLIHQKDVTTKPNAEVPSDDSCSDEACPI